MSLYCKIKDINKANAVLQRTELENFDNGSAFRHFKTLYYS